MANIPAAYPAFLAKQFGPSEAEQLIAGYATEGKTSLRLHPNKLPGVLPLSPVLHSQGGYFLPKRPLFILDPIWHAGGYYVQEAASMIIGSLVRHLAHPSWEAALDLCAAPGGKTTDIASQLPASCLLVANEVIKTRHGRLLENVQKWGLGNVATTSVDASIMAQRLDSFFDLIVADAPCSGEGLFRKDANAAAEWSEDHVVFCADRQQRIVADIWPALKAGGLLIYSTCTLNKLENEENIAWMQQTLGAEILPIPEEIASLTHAKDANGLGLRFAPGAEGGEGFFVSILRKKGVQWDGKAWQSGKKSRIVLPHRKVLAEVERWIEPKANLTFFEHNEVAHLLPEPLRNILNRLVDSCPILYAGTAMGTLQPNSKEGMLPDAALATSIHLAKGRMPYQTWPMDSETALNYLHKDTLPGGTIPDGGFLATYAGLGLGWGKMIAARRVNNHYPAPRRILMDVPQGDRWSLLAMRK